MPVHAWQPFMIDNAVYIKEPSPLAYCTQAIKTNDMEGWWVYCPVDRTAPLIPLGTYCIPPSQTHSERMCVPAVTNISL